MRSGCRCPLGPVAEAPTTLPASAAPHGSQTPTHSSRMSTTSVRFSKTSCSVMTLGCSTCRRMLTSRSISSRDTPRRLALLCRFLMNLAAYSSPVLFSRHFFTMANWPLWGHRPAQSGCNCVHQGSDQLSAPDHTNSFRQSRTNYITSLHPPLPGNEWRRGARYWASFCSYEYFAFTRNECQYCHSPCTDVNTEALNGFLFDQDDTASLFLSLYESPSPVSAR